MFVAKKTEVSDVGAVASNTATIDGIAVLWDAVVVSV